MSETETPAELGGFKIGEVVHDREADDPDDAIVIDLPDATADEWTAYGETTVAEDNPEYPADAPVVLVAFGHSVRDHLADEWDGETALAVENDALKAYYYSFPAPRLRPAPDAGIDVTDLVNAPDAEGDESHDETGETALASDDEPDPEPPEPEPPEPSEATLALKERLEDAATVALEDDGETLTVEKLGTTYRVRPGEVVEGDGPLRARLESIVADY